MTTTRLRWWQCAPAYPLVHVKIVKVVGLDGWPTDRMAGYPRREMNDDVGILVDG